MLFFTPFSLKTLSKVTVLPSSILYTSILPIFLSEKGEISLSDIWKNIQENEKNAEEMQQQLIPNVEIFKEIMVELIRNKEINMEALKKERSEFIQDQTHCINLTHLLPPPVLSEPAGNYSGSEDSSP